VCSPVLALSVLGTIGKANAAHEEGLAAAQIDSYNAGLKSFQASEAVRRGVLAVTRVRVQTRQFIGGQRAALAAQGVALDSGTALQLQTDAAYQGEIDALETGNQAAMTAWGYRMEARGLRYQGRLATYAGNEAAKGAVLGGAGDTYNTGSKLGSFS
jgi:hypothetical protein